MKVHNTSAILKRLTILLFIVAVILTGCGSALTTSRMNEAEKPFGLAGPKIDKNNSSNSGKEDKITDSNQSNEDLNKDKDIEQNPQNNTDQKSAQESSGPSENPRPEPNTDPDADTSSNAEPISNPEPNRVPEPNREPEPETPPIPNPPGTPIRPFYTQGGDPPTAPGLAMKKRYFIVEPQKIAYITIDDGPHPYTTPKILDILKEEQISATFFVIGRQAERYPEILKAEYENGHAIGNHTYSHDYKEIYQSPEAFLANIRKGEEVIEGIIGERPRIIRAPGGTHSHFDINYYNLLDANGYLVYDWNVSIGDTAAPLVPAEQLFKNLQSQIVNHNRAIILMHDIGGKSTTVEALPKIIKYLKENGYSFGALTPEVMPIVFSGGFSR